MAPKKNKIIGKCNCVNKKIIKDENFEFTDQQKDFFYDNQKIKNDNYDFIITDDGNVHIAIKISKKLHIYIIISGLEFLLAPYAQSSNDPDNLQDNKVTPNTIYFPTALGHIHLFIVVLLLKLEY